MIRPRATPMTPVSSEPTPSRIAGFDGLRAIAVTLVILWHVPSVLYFPRALLGPLGVVSSIGWIGVDLFFVLSGYLITTLLLREEAQSPSGRFSMGGFYLRRSLRILPAFVAVMALNYTLLSRHPLFTSVGVGAVIAHNDWRQLTAFALFLGNYWGPYAWRLWRPVAQVGPAVGVTWSLCVEEHFYLLWPMLLRAFPRARLHLALSTCVLVLGVRYVVAAARLDHHVALHLATHYRIDSILWGAALALYSATRPMPGARVRRTALALLGGLTALCVATGHLGALPRSTPLGHSLGLTLLALLSVAVIAEVVAAPQSALVRALEARPLRALGARSYGVYLVHFWAIDLTRPVLFHLQVIPSPAVYVFACTVTLLIAMALATVLYHAVERPFLALKDRMRTRPAAAASVGMAS